MRNHIKYVTRKRYLINPLTIRAAIKRNDLLRQYLGCWCASARVSGWGHTYGYIQVESKLVECNQISRDEYRDICENVYTTEVSLYSEENHLKASWTDAHRKELEKLLAEYKLKIKEV